LDSMASASGRDGPQIPAMASRRRFAASLRSAAFVLCSGVLHAALFLAFAVGASKPLIDLKLPDNVELGIIDPDPGAQGAPPPAASKPSPPPKPPPTEQPEAPVPAVHEDGDRVVADAGVTKREAEGPPDAAVVDPDADNTAAAAAAEATGDPSLLNGNGASPNGFGPGLGFGAGGFGSGTGGPPGAIIGLHADLDEIRDTSLILETRALLELIPEWERLLQGSGLDPLDDFKRVFVGTPNLKRSSLVVSAELKGGADGARRAAEKLAQERGTHAAFVDQAGLPTAPWYNHGATERSVALVGPGQVVIARPEDVGRALSVSAALAQRHQKQAEMEHAPAPRSLLAMYEGEAAALSIEGLREFVAGDDAYVPAGVRVSLRHLDEFNAEMRVYGYYESQKRAQSAMPRLEQLRVELADHPRAIYLGLKSAIEECKIERTRDTVVISTRLTMHQIRYLMALVSNVLRPKDD
jgi:hypothetical protein